MFLADPDICLETVSTDKVKIHNKKRERFQLEVAQELTLNQVSINSLDSVLYSGNDLSCLNERRQCCELQDDGITVVNADSTDSFSCSDSFVAL